MDRAVFERMAAQEEVHWWFAARRDIIRTVIERLVTLPEAPRVLEAGCGTGGNLEMLTGFGQVRAFELDETARQTAAEKSGLAVAEGALPGPLPFEAERFDLIGLFDVLEHVEDDHGALTALADRLSPEGRILLTVPAFPWLWSAHDERHHHFRRYTRASLRATAQDVELEVEHCFYFNTLLFPVAMGLRMAKSVLGRKTPDDELPSARMNGVLRSIFGTERHLVGRVAMPFGMSLCVVIKKGST